MKIEGNIKVLIADDHHMFRQGFAKQINSDGSFEIVGQAGDGVEAFALIKKLKPDIAVLDINMPKLSGLEVVTKCEEEKLPVEFVILTMYKEKQYFLKAVELGVKGYILKENTFEDLIACLKAVADGRHYISPLLSEYMLDMRAQMDSQIKETPQMKELTQTEREILKLIAGYKTSKDIAEELFISYRTVEKHRSNICFKLGLKGSGKLLRFALEHKSIL